jgi:hypothetical protein
MKHQSLHLLLCFCFFATTLVVGFQAILPKQTSYHLLVISKYISPLNNKEVSLRSSSDDEAKGTNYEEEETLMSIHLSVEGNLGDVKESISKYIQSFPFSAILPVQPLQYMPASDGGVEVNFLRKKTEEKGSLDGGMRFFLKEERDGYDIVCKRNSFGQTISKMFSEKLVIIAFIKSLTGQDTEKAGPPPESVSVESIFHKWL